MMLEGLTTTRRIFARILAGAAAGSLLRRPVLAASFTGDRLSWGAEPALESGHERRYRCNAQAFLLSIPLVRWPNVGGGSVVWRETASGAASIRLLEFTGFSAPERAA